MGGLGLGAYVLGRVADRLANPARFYGLLEIAIGLFGLASAWVFEGVGVSYIAAARWLAPGVWLATAIKFLVAFAVLLVPTFLMGGTLPLLTRAFAGARLDQFRRQLALFYGINTLGGVVGCALAGYVLIEYVGLRGTLLAVGTVNLLLGAAALMLARGVTQETLLAGQEDGPRPGPGEDAITSPVADATTRRLAIWMIAVTAFASLLYEIAWTRILVLVVGSSTYAFTTILAAFLAGIGIGSLFAIGKGRPPRELLLGAALIQGAIAVLAALLFPFFRGLPVYIVGTMQVGFLSAVDLLTMHGLAVVAVVLPPAVWMGLCFPLLAELAVGPGGKTGGETGRAYFANTLGSILGSVLTGFVLIHLLGSERTLVVGVLVNAGAAALMVWWLWRERGGSRAPLQLERIALLLGGLALVITFGTPSWSHRTLDRGPAIYGREHMTRVELVNFLRGLGAEQLSFEEGWNATVSVWRNGGATWLKTNGKSDASSVADMNTQVLVSLLPALAHPSPRRAFVVGLGSGVSVRTLADVPGVERVDVVEIERAVLRASRFFDFLNRDVLADPKVHVIEDDARSALQLAREPYDIIVSEPSNPWIAGIAALFTADYFRVAASRLNPDGILAQWLQTYRVPPSLVAVVVANVRAVFPHVEVWWANPSDLIILASRRPIPWNRQRVAGLMAPPGPIRTALRDWLRIDHADQLLGHFLLGDRGSAMLAAGADFTHSDDRPALEFVAARHLLVGPRERTTFDSLLVLKMAAGDTVPSLRGWPVAKDEVLQAYVEALPAYTDLTRTLARRLVDAAPDDPARQAGMGLMLFERREYRPAVEHLALALAKRPNDPRLLLASSIAHFGLGDTAAARRLLLRAREAGGDTVYASALLAEIAARQGDDSAAAADALRALRGLRPTIDTPFPLPLDATLRLLASRASPEVAGEVFEVAAATRPSWDLAYWGGAQVFSRGGQLGCRRAERLAGQLSRFGWTDEEIYQLLRACTAGRSD
jgi:predicted membrane-bound spermidine synthase/tetratricopeptide (TPR) repeat protein